MRRNYLKDIFLTLMILAILISYIHLIQSFTNRYEYTPNNKNDVELTGKGNKNLYFNVIENLRYSANPENFTLTINKNSAYEGEPFILSWTASIGADNYSIYSSIKNITKIDGNCTLIKKDLTRLNYTIIARDIGLIYYVVVAYNKSGDTLSNCVKINILESEGGGDNGDYGNEALFLGLPDIKNPLPFLIAAIMILFLFSSVMYYKVKRKNIVRPEDGIFPEYKPVKYIPIEFKPNSYVDKDAYKEYGDKRVEDIQGIKRLKSVTTILNGTINNKNLLKSIEEARDLKKFELSSISPDFLNKVDKFKWDNERQKVEFIKEMFALTPEERDDIINYMIEKSNKDDFFINTSGGA